MKGTRQKKADPIDLRTMKERIAVYPGFFDPITNGHLDLIQRGLRIFDHIIVAVAEGSFKKTIFTVAERLEMIREALADTANVTIDSFQGLLVDYVKSQNARAVWRGPH